MLLGRWNIGKSIEFQELAGLRQLSPLAVDVSFEEFESGLWDACAISKMRMYFVNQEIDMEIEF